MTQPEETARTAPDGSAPDPSEEPAAAAAASGPDGLGGTDTVDPGAGDPAGAGAPVGDADAEPSETEASDPVADTQRALEERTLDLQRLQAEFLNYKRRVERDRELLRENARYDALAPIIEVLDTIDRARESASVSGHELDGGLKAVAEQLERTVARLGLTKFGEPGDPFDPTLHEALSHLGEDPEVQVTTCKVVAKAGYRIGDRVVRAAQVLVADPAS